MTRSRLGGLLLLLAVAYLAGEAWAVAGWEGRPYSWSGDAISSLGVPEVWHTDGGELRSTRHAAMNATFIGNGVRVLLATAVLAPFVPRLRGLVLPLAVVHGVGVIVVGLFPAGVTSARVTGHGIGAFLAIVGGAVLLVALLLAVGDRSPTLGAVTAVLAAVSITGCLLAVLGVGGFGLAERLAVDTVILWQVVAGLVLLAGVSRPGRGRPRASTLEEDEAGESS